MSQTNSWEQFPHGADTGIRGIGATPAGAFEQAALALSAAVTDLDRIRPRETVRIDCEEADLELLLVDWLNAVIYEMTTRNMLFRRYRVQLEDGRLSAEADGEAIDRRRHEPAVEPKGATYTELRVARQPDGLWLAQCVIDV
jgi:tRNA nucleotidyltransferase (CCA-adding enzyme)